MPLVIILLVIIAGTLLFGRGAILSFSGAILTLMGIIAVIFITIPIVKFMMQCLGFFVWVLCLPIEASIKFARYLRRRGEIPAVTSRSPPIVDIQNERFERVPAEGRSTTEPVNKATGKLASAAENVLAEPAQKQASTGDEQAALLGWCRFATGEATDVGFGKKHAEALLTAYHGSALLRVYKRHHRLGIWSQFALEWHDCYMQILKVRGYNFPKSDQKFRIAQRSLEHIGLIGSRDNTVWLKPAPISSSSSGRGIKKIGQKN